MGSASVGGVASSASKILRLHGRDGARRVGARRWTRSSRARAGGHEVARRRGSAATIAIAIARIFARRVDRRHPSPRPGSPGVARRPPWRPGPSALARSQPLEELRARLRGEREELPDVDRDPLALGPSRWSKSGTRRRINRVPRRSAARRPKAPGRRTGAGAVPSARTPRANATRSIVAAKAGRERERRWITGVMGSRVGGRGFRA